MRNLITLLTAAAIVVACADDPHPTAPGARSPSGNVQPTADKLPVGQAKPADQVGFTKITRIFSNKVLVPAGGSGAATATCPAGTTVIGGGHALMNGAPATGAPRLSYSVDDQGNGWTVGFANVYTGAGSFDLVAVAYCVS